MEIVTRSQAKELGLNRYFTGVSCRRGHVAERITSSATCVECKSIQEAARYHSGKGKRYCKSRYESNREHFLTMQKCYDMARHNEKLLYGQQWRASNTTYAKVYRIANAGLYAHHAAKRRFKVARATPKWAEWALIKQLYKRASELGMVVDHIVPISHPLVCGLHCIANLQLLTAQDNLHKSNTFTVH